MNTATIWYPRPATRGYAIESMHTGHVWRRAGKSWMVTQISDIHIVLTEVIYLPKVHG